MLSRKTGESSWQCPRCGAVRQETRCPASTGMHWKLWWQGVPKLLSSSSRGCRERCRWAAESWRWDVRWQGAGCPAARRKVAKVSRCLETLRRCRDRSHPTTLFCRWTPKFPRNCWSCQQTHRFRFPGFEVSHNPHAVARVRAATGAEGPRCRTGEVCAAARFRTTWGRDEFFAEVNSSLASLAMGRWGSFRRLWFHGSESAGCWRCQSCSSFAVVGIAFGDAAMAQNFHHLCGFGPTGASHDSLRTPNVNIRDPRRFKTPPKFQRPPSERGMKENCGGRGKKREILRSTLRGPTLRGLPLFQSLGPHLLDPHPSRPPPLGAPPFGPPHFF